MIFGLRNAPETFQRDLDIIMSAVRWKTCLVYIYDVAIFSNTEEEQFEEVSHVLIILEEAGVKLKLKKCSFFHQRVEHLGHVITPGRLSITNDTRILARCARQASLSRSYSCAVSWEHVTCTGAS